MLAPRGTWAVGDGAPADAAGGGDAGRGHGAARDGRRAPRHAHSQVPGVPPAPAAHPGGTMPGSESWGRRQVAPPAAPAALGPPSFSSAISSDLFEEEYPRRSHAVARDRHRHPSSAFSFLFSCKPAAHSSSCFSLLSSALASRRSAPHPPTPQQAHQIPFPKNNNGRNGGTMDASLNRFPPRVLFFLQWAPGRRRQAGRVFKAPTPCAMPPPPPPRPGASLNCRSRAFG